MENRSVLGVLGLLVGASIAMVWELKSAPTTVPQPVAAALTEEPDQAATESDPWMHAPAVAQTYEKRISLQFDAADETRSKRVSTAQNDQMNRPPEEPVFSPPATAPAMPAGQTPASTTPRIEPEHLRISSVLVGGELIAAGLLPDSVLDDQEKHSKYIICFVMMTAEGQVPESARPRWDDFRLEDDHGVIASPLSEVQDKIAQPAGHSLVFFAIYNDSAPARLLYRTADDRFRPLPAFARR